MSKPTRISVVLAAYNGSFFIEEQIQSLLNILGKNDEIVVADDSSLDDTLEVLNTISDSRLRVLSFKDRVGYQRNFERAIAECNGEYIFFSDQDDICLPDRIELSLIALQSYGCVCGDAKLVDTDLGLIAPSYFALRQAEKFNALRLFVFPVVIGATVACTRDYLLDKLPFPDGVPHDQWLSVIAAMEGQLSIQYKPFILYRRHAQVTSCTGVGSRRRPLFIIIKERVLLFIALIRYFKE
jgi:glycosyltransferase involved in cell wall biosynthesis